MNWVQFRVKVQFHMCPAGAVVAYWALTQDVAGSSPFTGMTNIFVSEFSENIWEKVFDAKICIFLHSRDSFFSDFRDLV